MDYPALDHMLHILGHRHLPSSNNTQNEASELRKVFCIAPDGDREGELRKTFVWRAPRVEPKLAGTRPWTWEPSLASKVSPRYPGKKEEVEKLWLELFSDPTEWTDHRSDKLNPRFPDFLHKKHTEKALWLDSRWIPPWVEARLAALPTGSIQLSAFARNQRLSRYTQAGKYNKTMELFQQMQRDGHTADRFTFLPVLKACARLGLIEQARHIHQMMQPALVDDLFIGSGLVDMYCKCGSIEDAEIVFNQMPTRDVVAWNAMIVGYVKCGEAQKALELFEQMQAQEVDPDMVTFSGVLNACASVAALEVGRSTHEEIVRRGYESEVMGTCLVDMYAKCGSLEEAEIVFNQMPTRDVVAWNAMIGGFVKCGEGKKALKLFGQMQGQGVDPTPVTFIGVLNACASIAALEIGRCAHEEIIGRGFQLDVFVGNCLVDMYAKCGSLEEAEMVFNQMPTRDVVSWNVMIGGYVKCGEGQKALDLFGQMQSQGVDPGPVTFVGVLNACASLGALEVGRRVHEEIVYRGYELHMVVGNCLIDMYAKCGRIEEAENVFNQMPRRDVVFWNAMIVGYVKCGEGQKALDLFGQMQGQGMDPNRVTFVGVLNACVSVGALEVGRHAHEEIICRGYESDVFVGTCLVDMYSKCGSIEEAERVFNQMCTTNVVTWNAMIVGYVKCGEGQKALELFEKMQGQGVDPNLVTFVGVLNACASLAALEEGRRAHDEVIHRGYEGDVVVGTCLVDMYAKCGSIGEAKIVFNQMPTRDVVAWNALLAGYSIHGYAGEALETFKQMVKLGEVDGSTFISLLTACSHGGLVNEGLEYFKSMSAVYNITPTMEHFTCVVDLLGRSGCLDDAEDLIMSMPMDPDGTVWMSLLGACRTHVNVEVGERCAKRVLELDPDNAAAYAMLANIYVAAVKLNSSAKLYAEC